MKQLLSVSLLFVIYLSITSCDFNFNSKASLNKNIDTILKPAYAKRFFITQNNKNKTLHIVNANNTTKYQLVENSNENKNSTLENKIAIPLKKIIASSTTDISFFESLGCTQNLVGFSQTNYISSIKTRELIQNNSIKEVGKIAQLNTEVILDLQPELFISSSSPTDNKNLSFLKQNNITILHNTSWLETHPLGRAEWIKVFGYLFNKQQQADSIFSSIETNYKSLLKIANQSKKRPTVLSGNLYKDVWYTPAGASFEAQLIKDANGNYLWKNSLGAASLSLSVEAVLDKGQKAEIWLGGGLFNSIEELSNFEEKYTLFDATKTKQVYTKDLTQGTTGGIWYFEIGALRPDWILEDLIQIFHPDLLPKKAFHFYKKLD